MANLIEDVLSGMSSNFTKQSDIEGVSAINVNLNNDKTLKWRGLLKNKHASKNIKKTDGATTIEEKIPQCNQDAKKIKKKRKSRKPKNGQECDISNGITNGKTNKLNNIKKESQNSIKRLNKAIIESRDLLAKKSKHPIVISETQIIISDTSNKNLKEIRETVNATKNIFKSVSVNDNKKCDKNSNKKIEYDFNNAKNDDTKKFITMKRNNSKKLKLEKRRSSRLLKKSEIRERTKSNVKTSITKMINPNKKSKLTKLDSKSIENAISTVRQKRKSYRTDDDNNLLNAYVKLQKINDKPVQRPLRRIKPTVKVLENEELLLKFKTRINSIIPYKLKQINYKGKMDNRKTIIETRSVSSRKLKRQNSSDGQNNLNITNIYSKIKSSKRHLKAESVVEFSNLIQTLTGKDGPLSAEELIQLNECKYLYLEALGLKKTATSSISEGITSNGNTENVIPLKKNKFDENEIISDSSCNKENNICINDDYNKFNETNIKNASNIVTINCPDSNNEIENNEFIIEKLSCLCHRPSIYYSKHYNTDNICSAIEEINGIRIGCNNLLTEGLVNLFRPSKESSFMTLCSIHKRRLRAHNICVLCGIFCTMGKFVVCSKRHFVHESCVKNLKMDNDLKNDSISKESEESLKCPHCSNEISVEPTTILVSKNYIRSPKLMYSNKSSVEMSTIQLSTKLDEFKFTLEELQKLIPMSIREKAVRSEKKIYRLFTISDIYDAIVTDNLDQVAGILGAGFKISSVIDETRDSTGLHLVAKQGSLQMAYLLVFRRPSSEVIDKRDWKNRTAVMCAAKYNNASVLKLLVQYGANLEIKNDKGMSPLHIAAANGQLESLKIIIGCMKNSTPSNKFKNYICAGDLGGWTALIWAAEKADTEIFDILLENGANPNAVDFQNNSALHWAALYNREDLIRVLLNQNININAQNDNGDTALHLSCRLARSEIALLLIGKNANISIRNRKMQKPYDCVPDKNSEFGQAIGNYIKLRLEAMTIVEGIYTSSDISHGRELIPIAIIRNNELSTDIRCPLPEFTYVTKCVVTKEIIDIDYRVSDLSICKCVGRCIEGTCTCFQSSMKCWYTSEGRLYQKFNYKNPPIIFECSDMCACDKSKCKNRVVQRGIKLPLEVFESAAGRGWGVRTLKNIPRGTFIAEYMGEILTDEEANYRSQDSYIFDMNDSGFCIDSNFYGNVTRFLNHSCDPNLISLRVFFDHGDLKVPKLAFFAYRNISEGEELMLDYGSDYWRAKEKLKCTCGSNLCKYKGTA